jgi:antitoxin ParD1/3/4
MSAPFQLTQQATEDLDRIWSFIAADSEEAADRVESEMVRTCQQLARSPLIGHKRTDITTLPVRFWTPPRYPNYVIVYRPETRPLQIVAILHGRQDLERRIADRQLP